MLITPTLAETERGLVLIDVGLESVKVHSPTESSRETFAAESSSELGIDATAVASSAEAASERYGDSRTIFRTRKRHLHSM
ncbi:hypothetical protein B2G88_06390 [Natronolimnobius baerhuensis]|uniref:Uncharacterized protein n=1 Tax=Natronolimnobius baerhuensis TaxID=253108 RepID=A0A202E7Y0_9EURY|nr:hypothetical protein B2G88_06390 [Natronolimnobius baerhuensis]